MISNLDRYKKDLDELIKRGELLELSMEYECAPERFPKDLKPETKKMLDELPSARTDYQSWYSEAGAVIKQLLPDRLTDFVRHYEKPKPRKDISFENYRIEDYLQSLKVTKGFDNQKIVGPEAATPHFLQQISILKSVQRRFESSLFDIKQLVQADLFDSELEAAAELAKNKFLRAAGAIAGVVLERHLRQVCENHSVTNTKKDPTISTLNDLLKNANVIDVPQWRFIQHLGDIRNLCDHDKKTEPTAEQVNDLIAGVKKTIKTLF